MPLFCGSDLAARIERAEAQLTAEATEAARRRRADGGGFVIPVAGGVATFAEAGSSYNKIAGLGFGGLPAAVPARTCRGVRSLPVPEGPGFRAGRGQRARWGSSARNPTA